MKNTKDCVCALLLLTLLLALCGCGKNEAVASAEAIISAIGQVSLERREDVIAARAAFNVLPPKLQAKVENADLLTEAEKALAGLEAEQARLEEEALAARAQACTWLEGEWVDVSTLLYSMSDGYEKAVEYASENGITFAADGTCVTYGVAEEWECQGRVVTVWGTEYTLDESLGYPILRTGLDRSLVRRDMLDDVFVAVELTEENVGDYIELVDMPFEKYDEFGKLESSGSWVWLKSKVYDQGLVLVTQRDMAIEVSSGRHTNTNTLEPFGPMWDFILDSRYYASKAKDCAFGRVKGTLFFARVPYAQATVTGGFRDVKVFDTPLDRWQDPQYVPLEDSCVFY